MYIKRNLEGKILNFLDAPEIIAVVGARQSGKTTMINHLMSKLKGVVSISFKDQSAFTLRQSLL